jgi:ATP-dependent Lhr-like helicase
MARTPPDILITTPESLFLLLTSRAGAFLADVETVIIDEIHSVAGTKRGSHLSLSLARLDLLTQRPAQRIGLSATVTPVDAVAEYLHSGHDVRIVAPPTIKPTELQLAVPLADMTTFDEPEEGGPRRASIWPAVEQSILRLIEEHTSTIVFTNSRRVCERLSSRLNELASDDPADDSVPAEIMAMAGAARGSEQVVARAHHGSVSKSERAVIEDALKAGRLPAVVATSSLELGIDMGSIDLMVQVGCPPSSASGLQRLGRAGHRLDAVSKGVFFPTHRADLLATTVAVRQMRAGRIEATKVPQHPLDVLSQQIVAMVAMADWHTDDLFEVITGASGYTRLPRSAFDAVLDMLSGRYPSDDFAQLRPRLVWDRTTGMLTARQGAQRTAVISGGTIPDRGLFPVFIVGTKDSRVGELDEEMVYESRVGDVISLGASSWRIEEITHDRVLVTPAPGRPGKLPFWHADAQGRSFEMGEAIGSYLREAESARLPEFVGSDLAGFARENLVAYLTEQLAATGMLPTDRRIIVERFRDEIGDWRLVVHAPWGARVTAPWALLVSSELTARLGIDADVMATDDGLVLRLLDTEQDSGWWEALLDALLVDPDDLTSLLTREITRSAIFAAKFRECSSRALLLTRNAPGRRTPLWQQRQRSAQLLSVAADYPSFPMVLEAVRECLDDVYDVPALRHVMTGLRDGLIDLEVVETPTASPMAQSQMFSYVSVFMYEADNPLGQQAAALELDQGLLADLLSDADLRSIIPQEAIDAVEGELQWRQPGRVDSVDRLTDLLREVGFQTHDDLASREIDPEIVAQALKSRRAFTVRLTGQEVVAAVEDLPRLRDALGVVLPPEVPLAFTEPVADPVGDLIGRYTRTHGPFSSREVAEHLGLGLALVEQLLRDRKERGHLRWGRFSAVRADGQWVDPTVLQRIRRRAAAILRGAQEPVPAQRLCTFLPRWHALGSPGRGPTGVMNAIERLAGYVAAATVWEQDLLPVRVSDYAPHLLDQLTSAGELIWCGTGRLGAHDSLITLVPATHEDLLPRWTTRISPNASTRSGVSSAGAEAGSSGTLRHDCRTLGRTAWRRVCGDSSGARWSPTTHSNRCADCAAEPGRSGHESRWLPPCPGDGRRSTAPAHLTGGCCGQRPCCVATEWSIGQQWPASGYQGASTHCSRCCADSTMPDDASRSTPSKVSGAPSSQPPLPWSNCASRGPLNRSCWLPPTLRIPWVPRWRGRISTQDARCAKPVPWFCWEMRDHCSMSMPQLGRCWHGESRTLMILARCANCCHNAGSGFSSSVSTETTSSPLNGGSTWSGRDSASHRPVCADQLPARAALSLTDRITSLRGTSRAPQMAASNSLEASFWPRSTSER